jgi:hypothetical protein
MSGRRVLAKCFQLREDGIRFGFSWSDFRPLGVGVRSWIEVLSFGSAHIGEKGLI